MSSLPRNPWLFVVFAFVLLITAWSSLIVIAVKHRPETIDLPHSVHAQERSQGDTLSTQ